MLNYVFTKEPIRNGGGKNKRLNNQTRKRNKGNPDWKRSKTLFVDDMILYIENTKDTTSKLLELINEYSEVTGYQINTQKSLEFLY